MRRDLLDDLQEGFTISLTVQGTQTDPSSLETAREELIRTLAEGPPKDIDDLIRRLETVKANRARQLAIENFLKTRQLRTVKANRARQLAIENCLMTQGGVYVWHVAGLNVKFVDLPKVHTTHMADFKSTHRALLTDDLVTKALSFLSLPGGWQAALVCKAYRTCWQRRYLGEEELCVVKVGMTMDQSIDSRLKQELTDTTQWRVNPRLHMTAEGLKDGRKDEAIYVGHLVACFPGRSWSGWEKIIKRCLGLPFGE